LIVITRKIYFPNIIAWILRDDIWENLYDNCSSEANILFLCGYTSLLKKINE